MIAAKKLFLLWIIFIFVYLVGIYQIPIFEDEAEYLLLADQIVNDPFGNFLIYLQNGIFPGFGWLVAIATKFIGDSLIAGRILNIFLASSLVFLLAKIGELYKLPSNFALISILLLIASPALLLNARIALLDTSVLVFTAWYIYFTAKLVKKPVKLIFTLLFLFVLLSFLIKPNAIFGLPAAALIILWNIREKGFKKTHLRIFLTYALGIFLPLSFYLSFSVQINEVTGSSLVANLNDIIYQIKQNLFLTFHWSKVYYVQYIIPILLIPFFFQSIKNRKIYLIMLVWIASTLVGMVVFNRFYFPRHTLMLVLPLIVIAAGILSEFPRKVGIFLVLIIILSKFDLDWKITTTLSTSPIALEDKFSYFENYTSGKNLGNISIALANLSKSEQITVWLDGSYVMEYGLRRELENNNKVNFKSFRMDENFFPHEPGAVYKTNDMATYVISNRWFPANYYDLEEVSSFDVSFRHTQKLHLVE